MKRTWIVGGLFTLAACAQAQIDLDKSVATVNGESIKGSEYYRRMEFLGGVGKRIGDSFMESPPGFLTLLQLVGEKLIFQLAKEKGVTPSKAEIDAELKIRIESDPKLLERWGQAGRSQAELEEDIRFDLAQFKLQTYGINVADQEVEKFYKDNPTAFTSPKSVKVRLIAVADASAAQAVDADLAAKKPFEDVAKARSVDVTNSVGGLLGTVPVGFLPPAARAPVNGLKIGQTTNWLDISGKKVKYYLADVIPPKLQPLSPERKRATRRRLMLDRGRVKNNLVKEIEAMRAKSKIVIVNKEFAEMYDKMIDTAPGA